MKNVDEIIVKNNKFHRISVSVVFFKPSKENLVIAECPALNISTFGKDLKQARKMFEEAFSLWKESVDKDYDIGEVLKSLGWKLTKTICKPATDIRFSSVPVNLLATDTKNICIPVRA